MRGLSVLLSVRATLRGREGGGGGRYGGVDIAEAVVAVEVVGLDELPFQRSVCAESDYGWEFLEIAVARGEVVCETPFALFFKDVEHGDCVP